MWDKASSHSSRPSTTSKDGLDVFGGLVGYSFERVHDEGLNLLFESFIDYFSTVL